MIRTTAPDPDTLRRVRRDVRFRLALEAGAPETGWRSRAACLTADPELFFPTAAEDPSPAMRICRTCPVLGSCLAAALDTGECDGVWGGTTPDERRVMRHAWVRTPVRVHA